MIQGSPENSPRAICRRSSGSSCIFAISHLAVLLRLTLACAQSRRGRRQIIPPSPQTFRCESGNIHIIELVPNECTVPIPCIAYRVLGAAITFQKFEISLHRLGDRVRPLVFRHLAPVLLDLLGQPVARSRLGLVEAKDGLAVHVENIVSRTDCVQLTAVLRAVTLCNPRAPGGALAIPQRKTAGHGCPIRFAPLLEPRPRGACVELCIANASRHVGFLLAAAAYGIRTANMCAEASGHLWTIYAGYSRFM